MASTERYSDSKKADHLCVLVHGLWGNPSHLNYLTTSLREQFPEDQLHILNAKSNSHTFTYDGIEVGGERVTREIEEILEDLARHGQQIRKLSVIGYSLGGLVARYSIGLLYSKGWFDKLEPINFTTFATPHLGVRTPKLGWRNQIWNVLGARTLSVSGKQLFTIDSFRDTGKPLLSVLADPGSIFIRALEQFKNRSLYANVVNDRSAAYYTTSISKTDPYVDIDKLKVNYVEGYEPVILDGNNPFTVKNEGLPSFYARLAGGSRDALNNLPFMLFLAVFIPVGSSLFLMNAVVQNFRSQQRIRLHEEGKAGIGMGLYRIPLMVNGVHRTAEGVFENVNSTQSQEYLPAGSEELASPNGSPTSPKFDHETSGEKALSLDKESNDGSSNVVKQKHSGDRLPGFQTLALTPDQFAMIQNLDAVGWKKHPVWIHQNRHSHAAIIVRMNRKSFEEGKSVAKHWLREFEI